MCYYVNQYNTFYQVLCKKCTKEVIAIIVTDSIWHHYVICNEGVIHRLIYVFLYIKCIIPTVKIYYLESVQIFRDLRLYDLLRKSKQFPVSERKCPNRRYLFKNQPSIETFVTELKICTETCVVIVGCYKISEFEFQKYFHLVIFWETI